MPLKRLLLGSSILSFDVAPRGFLEDEDRDDMDLCHVKYFISFEVGTAYDLEILKQ